VLAASVNGLLGHSVLIIGLVSSLFGAIALATATVTKDHRLLRSSPNYAWLAAGSGLAAAIIMLHALLTYDFDLAYVQQVGSRSTPTLFNITALWSALEGSILLWVLVLAGYIAAVMRKYRRRLEDPLVGWAMVVMFVVSAFFFFLAFGPTDVFKSAGTPDFTRCCLGANAFGRSTACTFRQALGFPAGAGEIDADFVRWITVVKSEDTTINQQGIPKVGP
jgi:cytochrome c-type biogenesis protein CcmF